MKLQKYKYSPRGGGSILLSLAFLLVMAVGCTEGLEKDSGSQAVAIVDDDEPEAIIQIGEDATRGAYVEGPSLTRYAVYSFYNDTKKSYLSNSELTRAQPGDPWTKSKTIKYPTATREMDFYAMAPEFTGSIVTNSKMDQNEKYIVYTLPTTNAKQIDFMFSSLMASTRKATNNIIRFNFKHMFVYLRFTGKLSNADIDVTIHSIKLHNLKSTGKFTMDNDKANTGSWTLENDAYADYEFILPKDSTLTYKKTLTLHRTDSLLFVMPQNPTPFVLAENSSFAEADANKQLYASVECRIVNKTTNEYVGCSPTTWARVYYPVRNVQWISTKQPYGVSKTVALDFTGGYTYEGGDFLKEHSGDTNLENTSVEGVKGGIYSTEDWVTDTDNSAIITL